MNEVVRSLLSRRSVRAYGEKQVPLSLVLQIVEVGRHAPSGLNRQPWRFTVLRNGEKLNDLSALIDGPGGGSFFYHAPTLVIVSIREGEVFAAQDTACAMTNMMQAAHALGVASVWCNGIAGYDGSLSAFGVEEGYKATASLALGYASVTPGGERKVREGTVTVIE